MALREDQVFRYSRQILLREVGGSGQERLLREGFRLVGEGAAQQVAAAYLAAAGCAVSAGNRPVRAGEEGFLVAAADVGRPLGATLARAVTALNPDAVVDGEGATSGELGEVPARFDGEGLRVALGALEEGAGVAWAAPGACGACFARAVEGLTPGLEGPLAVLAGSVAALVAERLVLGHSGAAGLVHLHPAHGLTPREPPWCPRCR